MRGGVFLALSLLVIGLALSACGKKGSPDFPDKQESPFPRKYPPPSS